MLTWLLISQTYHQLFQTNPHPYIKIRINSENDVYDIVYYIFKTQDSADFEQIVQQLTEQTEKHREAIMNIAQRLQDKGRQEGIEQGIKQERLRAARNLLKNGVGLELVMESIGLSSEELISLQ